MQVLAGVKKLDVFNHAEPKLLFISVTYAVNSFRFQRFEHVFVHGIVVAVAFASHALRHPVLLQLLSERFTGMLNTSI